MKKKLFSILLSLAMVVTMIPMMTGVAFAGEDETKKIADILPADFPTTDDWRQPPANAWVCETNIYCCYKDNVDFMFGGNSAIALSKPVEKIGDNYKYSWAGFYAITFNMEQDVLQSIEITSEHEDYDYMVGTYVPPTSYKITVAECKNGKVTADKQSALEGETVTLTVAPDNGYELDTLTVTDADGDSVEVIDNQFTMPDKAVTVSATFKAKSTPTPAPTDKGVKTGDSSDIIFYGFTTLLALLGAGFVYGLRRKEEK